MKSITIIPTTKPKNTSRFRSRSRVNENQEEEKKDILVVVLGFRLDFIFVFLSCLSSLSPSFLIGTRAMGIGSSAGTKKGEMGEKRGREEKEKDGEERKIRMISRTALTIQKPETFICLNDVCQIFECDGLSLVEAGSEVALIC